MRDFRFILNDENPQSSYVTERGHCYIKTNVFLLSNAKQILVRKARFKFLVYENSKNKSLDFFENGNDWSRP